MQWEEAQDIKKDIAEILSVIELPHVRAQRIFCYRSHGSTSRSYARIWSFPKIFQDALDLEPAYVIEVLAKYFDRLNRDEQKKVLIHELLHIPKNFSGALLPHRSRGRHLGKQVNMLFNLYKNNRK
ncbi:MAG TPA: putative metallopeptidase [Candidatus Saccharimonadales bacterium]|nr:putative metallopeptidase [Candidatus Saccharimonadales bacterium]